MVTTFLSNVNVHLDYFKKVFEHPILKDRNITTTGMELTGWLNHIEKIG